MNDSNLDGEQLIVEHSKLDSSKFPDIANVTSAILYDGPRSRKEAKQWITRDRNTGELHHPALSIKTFAKKNGQLVEKADHSITLEDSKDKPEISRLLDLVLSSRQGAIPENTARYFVVEAPEGKDATTDLKRLLESATVTGTVDILTEVLTAVGNDRNLLRELLQRVFKDPQLFAEAAAAINLARYKKAHKQLERLIDENALEGRFQSLLQNNPWMFGSEYSHIHGRKLTRDEIQDFVVRRTVDNYLEIIEIKTPLNGVPLFRLDESHKSSYPGPELAKVMGQVIKYVEKIDRNRNTILAEDGEDTCKIRAKIIIGRDGDEIQQSALRNFNGHLHRIEVITFDQLQRIAGQVLHYLNTIIQPVVTT